MKKFTFLVLCMVLATGTFAMYQPNTTPQGHFVQDKKEYITMEDGVMYQVKDGKKQKC